MFGQRPALSQSIVLDHRNADTTRTFCPDSEGHLCSLRPGADSSVVYSSNWYNLYGQPLVYRAKTLTDSLGRPEKRPNKWTEMGTPSALHQQPSVAFHPNRSRLPECEHFAIPIYKSNQIILIIKFNHEMQNSGQFFIYTYSYLSTFERFVLYTFFSIVVIFFLL